MKSISLTQGYVALVDDDDFERVSRLKWCTLIARNKLGTIKNVYATSRIMVRNKKKTLYMHRFILEITDRKIDVDHENHDGLDNQRRNLRTCTRSQNLANQRIRCTNTSGVKGVRWHTGESKWEARIRALGKQRSLGLFISIDDARRAYERAAKETFGEFSYAGNEQAMHVKIPVAIITTPDITPPMTRKQVIAELKKKQGAAESVRAFAARIGVSQPFLWQILAERRPPSGKVLAFIGMEKRSKEYYVKAR